ncbi:MAG TPA: 5'-methylthioadenosine/S-adenosylhomocysteine nucleosidase, partial [Nitrospirae bacterium]|nr:5'-methylthioadenosine/S-adenosylhomocysteine nucleosidase [Nitrospirota bacterium]
MIGLICSVDFECVKIHNELSKGRTFPLGGLEFIRGGLSGKEVVLTASGVGKTNAAHATTLMAERL